MARRPRRNHSGEFKARVALAAIRGDKTLAEIAEHFEVHSHQVTEWNKQLLERAGEVFGGAVRKDEAPVDVKAMQAKIGLRGLFVPAGISQTASEGQGRCGGAW